ncbi:MAG TPA: PAS domain S-box protein [Terriglobales bacterium]|nr:PAS domain S-box protein [Terriglobales bacterium]
MSLAIPFRVSDLALEDRLCLSTAFDVCAESLFLVEKGRIFHVNQAGALLFGFDSPQELQGRPLAELLPENRACTLLDVRQTSGTACGYPGCQLTGKRKDGSSVRMEAFCSRFAVQDRSFLVISLRDITQRERRRVVRDSDKRFRAIFQAAAMGITQCTMDGRVVESNPAVQRMLGYSREELRGMHFRDFTHPDDIDADLQLFAEMVAGKRDFYQIELRYVRKDSNWGWVRLTVSLVRGPDGSPEFAIGMTEEITEYKRAEQQLREAQKMEAIGRLVGGVAHDFNNLLTGIMLYCDLLISGLEDGGRLRHHAEEIRMAGEQGAALVQQLLAIGRQQMVEPRVLSLNEVVSGTTNLLSRLIRENIQLIMNLAEDLGKVKMDPAQVQQILLNLVLNARDAMPEGGMIQVQTRNGDAGSPSRAGDAAQSVCLEVTDNGCGMDRETRSRLFEPFFTTKKPGQGNGLGLATVYSVVKQNGGKIQVESEPGRGTQITIFLPRVDERDQTQQEVSDSKPCGDETVLLLDDNPTVRSSVYRVLSECGYRVMEAVNGPEALRLSQNYKDRIDLLLTDLTLPGMSGREVARQLCALRPELRVLYITGYDHTHSTEGQDALLFRKPFTGSALARRVRSVLDTKPAMAREERKG